MRSDQTELTLGTWDERKQPPPVIKHAKTEEFEAQDLTELTCVVGQVASATKQVRLAPLTMCSERTWCNFAKILSG